MIRRDGRDWPEIIACGVVSLIGVLLMGIHLWHGMSEFSEGLAPVIYGVISPLIVSLMIIGAGYWIAGRNWRSVSPWTIVGWSVGGFMIGAVIIGFLIIHQQAEGVNVSDPWFTFAMFGTYGMAGGLVLGRYNIKETRQKEQLANKTERLEEFTKIASHDLRNPLNVAAGNLELAQADCDNEHLNSVAQAHQRMEAIIENLLVQAQIGDSTIESEFVELEKIVQMCWGNVATGEATLVTDLEGSIYCSDSCLKQLLENLIRNAIDHGGPDVTVTVGNLNNGFYVEDDGPGIPVDQRNQVFDSGYSTRTDGTGFGLNIVQQIVESHGWEISISSSESNGARFEITEVELK